MKRKVRVTFIVDPDEYDGKYDDDEWAKELVEAIIEGDADPINYTIDSVEGLAN